MEIKESELPGIGRKFEIINANEDKVVIIIHENGRREIYHFDDDDYEESISGVSFNDNESRQIAAILGGMVYKPTALESVEIAFDDLIIEWHKIEDGTAVVDRLIGEIDIRNNYSINVIAIIKKDKKKLLSPGPDSKIEAGDVMVISGERKDIKRIITELLSKKGG
ncbi:cation:proton antiporter regulatory subunit [Jeotgalibacillus soli]|uniref:Potassium transporter n=1 Tax=Jeotgalibacillus soli TaxID=889306 RepID=A0A0C2VMZ7_9BACL|nr:cation:proton antiporter regulatory subunit [Jeotgalibacillus soli]KIL45826.1 potassium transporter [Jeotgalibacillus soli]